VNIKDYISSGIVESYVLGLASSEERAEFEKLSSQYPELVAARTDFELALEKQLLSQAVTPAVDVKQIVIDAIRQPNHANQTKVITMENVNQSRSSSAKWVAAASVILLLACGYFAYSYYKENEKLKKDLASTQQVEGNKSLDSLTQANSAIMKAMSDPNVAVINLKGTEKTPKSSASVYWDSTSSEVYIVAKNMPKPASDKQYQLWALINGKDGQLQPTSLGLFDVGDDGKVILKMDNAKKADAFAITIETKGNTGGPNLEQLQTMGKTTL
jgi:anti-sigma-K factor RskA